MMEAMPLTGDPVLQAQATVLKTAVSSGVQVSFGEGRRRSDLTLALLKGDRMSVLAVTPRLSEALPVDIEIVRSAQIGASYELMLALTERLEQQPLRSPERRAKLRRLASTGPVDEETSRLLDEG